MLVNYTHTIEQEGTSCPHSHKVSVLLENAELAGDFLSRHFESCEICNNKLLKLKNDRKVFISQIPFVTSTDEVKQIFESESEEIVEKIKRKVSSIKRKKINESNKHILLFLRDFKDALLSRPVVISFSAISMVWTYLKLFN